MYKPLLTFLIGLFMLGNTHAATIQDTVVKLKPRSQEWFQAKYGKDDTSKAIIDYFFLKRKKTLTPLLVSSGLSLAFAIASLVDPLGDRSAGESDSGPGWSLGMFFSVPVTVFYLFEYIKYSRKQLIRALQQYQSGKGVPNWLQRIPSWKNFLNNYI